MKRRLWILTIIFVSAILLTGCIKLKQEIPTNEKTPVVSEEQGEKTMDQLKLTSSQFTNGGTIPKRHTCDGENLSPPLSISGIPAGTQTLALIVDDSDAPLGTWVHWLVWNISPQYDEIPEGSPPPGALQGTNDFGDQEWGGPCPPPGPEHRYFFKLYALDTILELKAGARKQALEEAMEGHIVAQTQLVGDYGRGR